MRMMQVFFAVFIALLSMGFFHRGNPWPNPTGTDWSTLGVIADGVTDNTAALNALPTGTVIIGDCPAGGMIAYSGQWIWQSSLTIYQEPGCWLQCSYTNANLNNSCITQSDITTPITNVYYWGLQLKKPDLTYVNRSAMLWVDHLTLLYSHIDTYHQAFYLRGSDQEIGWCTSSNPLPAVGADFIRHFGNVPLVTTSPGRPANVWIHNCSGICGDACYQIGQPFNIFNWGNTDTDGVLVENSSGSSITSNMLLIGQPKATDPGSINYYITNVIARNLTGSGVQSAVTLGNSIGNAQAFSNILLQNVTLDGSNNTSNASGLFSLDSSLSTSPLNNITLDGVTCLSPYERCLVIDGVYNGITVKNSTFQNPRATGLPTIYIGQFISNLTLQNNTVGSNVSTAIDIGRGSDATAFVNTATIASNTVQNVGSNQAGIFLRAVTSANMTGNTVTQASGATNPHGVALTVNGSAPGTNSSTVTGNDFSAITGIHQVLCAIGQGNNVTANTGASDCPP